MPIDIKRLLKNEEWFDDQFDNDPSFVSFVHNDHLRYFGKLFQRLCDAIEISQNDLSSLSKRKYSRLLEKKILEAGVNIGSLDRQIISRAQLAYFRPTPQQIFFWLNMLKQCFQELEMELRPEIERAFYLLSLGGPPDEVARAIELVKKIEDTQQSAIARVAQKDTDFDLEAIPLTLQKLQEPQS